MQALQAVGGCACCLIACAASALPIVYVVYLGIYAFNNPDSEAWLGLTPQGKEALFVDEQAGEVAKAT